MILYCMNFKYIILYSMFELIFIFLIVISSSSVYDINIILYGVIMWLKWLMKNVKLKVEDIFYKLFGL